MAEETKTVDGPIVDDTPIVDTLDNEPVAEEKEPTLEERMAALEVENRKYKAAMDKAAHEAASYKKQLMNTKSEAEKAAMEKAELESAKEDKIKELTRKVTVTDFEKQFLRLGYDEKTASKAAELQYDGEFDELFKIQDAYNKKREQMLKSQWMKDQPVPPTENGEDDADIFKKAFMED